MVELADTPQLIKKEKMNKTELIDKIAEQTQLEKTKVARTINTFLDVVTDALSSHETVTLIGFGTFKVRRRKARKGVNPQTRKEMTIPATDVPVISFGESLKQSVAKKKKVKTFVTSPKAKKPAKKAAPKKSSKKTAKKKK
ncbi:MAG: HU family DNA-binding protein [Candidatus Caenarcaniphilales bacterium]|nr:HU family DNA-binding protein [Candidatus Caenarcaniphilales bacterium]